MGVLDQRFEKNFMITSVDYVFNWARKSAIWPLTFGLACCAIEMIASTTSRFDMARFGAEVFRPSPRQADLMIVAGTVTLKMAPVLKREERAHIVNLSSVFGLIAPPGQPAYSASKFAVRGFTECLRHELEGTAVRVSCVHPAGIRTAIARRARRGAGVTRTEREEEVARFEKLFRTSPEEAASRILRGVERREPRILIGADAYKIDILQRLRPGTYWKTLSRKLANIPRT